MPSRIFPTRTKKGCDRACPPAGRFGWNAAPTRRARAILAVCLAAQTYPALAQAPAAAPPTVITCTSLANLRAVLRGVNDDAAAAVPIVADPKSDLGCSVLDRGTVTGIADHVGLNGHAYDCLALQGTSICHWVVAGTVKPPVAGPAARAPATETGRR